MLYLVLYNNILRKLISMIEKKEIQFTEKTTNKLYELLNQTEKTTNLKNIKIKFLLSFKKYDFQTMEITDNETTKELFKFFLENGNKNLRYGLKIKN